LELVVSPDQKLAIAVMSGDSYVGFRGTGNVPRTKRPKGEGAKLLTKYNNGQGVLFPELERKVLHQTKLETWVLLHYRSASTVQLELSLPSGLDDQDYIDTWLYRICLPSLTFDNRPDIDRALSLEDFSEIDVPVTRKN
jgi:hypothetical protein